MLIKMSLEVEAVCCQIHSYPASYLARSSAITPTSVARISRERALACTRYRY